jgi:hypothetical protein
MSQSIFPGPIAPENNPPINPQYFQPSDFKISAISLGTTTTVTTSVNHNYVVGQNIRLLIPSTYGSRGLNERQGLVISIPAANQVIVNIDSSGITPFIASPSYGPTPPQIIAIGDQNSGEISSSGRTTDSSITGPTIPGTFINISP